MRTYAVRTALMRCETIFRMSGQITKSVAEKAFKILGNLPRVGPKHLRDNVGAKTKGRIVGSVHNKAGKSHKELQNAAKPPLGWIFGDWYKPWHRSFKKEANYNKDAHLKREYPPMSLLELQRLIDLGWLDVSQPIDLSTLCGTRQYTCDPLLRQYGVQLTDEGADIFATRVDIEVQWASELTIAAVERNGGTIVTAWFDPLSLDALVDPITFLSKGQPIPRRTYPPAEMMEFYTDPRCRGYLAKPDQIAQAKVELSQKYGYSLPKEPETPRLLKGPLQIFYGLEPGWVVNLKDQLILKPLSQEYLQYYNDV